MGDQWVYHTSYVGVEFGKLDVSVKEGLSGDPGCYVQFSQHGSGVTLHCTWEQVEEIRHSLAMHVQERQRQQHPETVAGETEQERWTVTGAEAMGRGD